MAWQTLDNTNGKRQKTGQNDDAEQRELRLRRTYNEAAAGHAARTNGEPAPPAVKIAALYREVLDEVGQARLGQRIRCRAAGDPVLHHEVREVQVCDHRDRQSVVECLLPRLCRSRRAAAEAQVVQLEIR